MIGQRWVCELCGAMKTRWEAATPEERERERAQTRRAQAERRALIRTLLEQAKDGPCADCGVRYPAVVMDFDHVRGQKRFNLSKAVQSPFSLTLRDVHDEIAKCDLVCANCHRLRTARSHYAAMRISRLASERRKNEAA
jgi:hypothetical protein